MPCMRRQLVEADRPVNEGLRERANMQRTSVLNEFLDPTRQCPRS
jgi:hypothetical protein